MSGDKEFEAFAASGEIEVGESNLASAAPAADEPKKDEKAPRRGPAKPAPAAAKPADKAGEEAGDDGDGEDDDKPKKTPKAGAAKEGEEAGEGDEGEGEEGDGEDEGEDDDKPKKPSRKPSDRIRDLTRRLREAERVNASLTTVLAGRADGSENGGLPNARGGGNSGVEETPAPDPTDTKKYPLGHLDDRYIEDKLEWLSERKATQRADAVLQRQQEAEQTRQAQEAQTALLEKVDDLATRGDELFDDFQESVVEAGMRGDWALSQPTFEAAHEAANGAQILYELSQDKKEAKRVAGLSPYQQLKFVQERDAEIGEKKKPRKIPKAGEPPLNQARGANSRTQINPATDNLDDFEKAWARDEKGSS